MNATGWRHGKSTLGGYRSGKRIARVTSADRTNTWVCIRVSARRLIWLKNEVYSNPILGFALTR